MNELVDGLFCNRATVTKACLAFFALGMEGLLPLHEPRTIMHDT